METLDRIEALIERRHLLTHSFYTRWVEGTLPFEAIQEYARRYHAFESAFPRVLSAIHSRAEDPSVRQALLTNLWDEEHGEENHVELWMRFAEGIGVSRAEVGVRQTPATSALVETYSRAAREGSVAAGVAAVYAYERQVPDVARAKIHGLREHYGIEDGRTLAFWQVHERLDVEHADAERDMLERVAAEAPQGAVAATEEALDGWWGFLSEVEEDAA